MTSQSKAFHVRYPSCLPSASSASTAWSILSVSSSTRPPRLCLVTRAGIRPPAQIALRVWHATLGRLKIISGTSLSRRLYPPPHPLRTTRAFRERPQPVHKNEPQPTPGLLRLFGLPLGRRRRYGRGEREGDHRVTQHKTVARVAAETVDDVLDAVDL